MSVRSSEEEAADSLAAVLRTLMKRPTYRVTPGLLSKLSGVPRATIVNWLDSRVTRPRHFQDVLKIADALRLSDDETDALLRAAGQPPAAALRDTGPSHGGGAALSSNRVGKSELPTPLTDLIGRDREIVEITAACRKPGMRLITLMGTGGVGKTRLAIAVAAGLADDFPGGIVWVPLAAHEDSADLLPAIATAIGAKESNAASMLRTLVQALHAERVLLVLDNVEQLVAGAPRLAALLEALPQVALLATSRVALRIRGERVFHIMPLSLPASPTASAEEVSASPAVALFAARAAAIGAQISVEHDAATVAAICARLDGLPLALELAAAWTRLLTPKALLKRLEHRLTLLTNGARDGAPRHQTLRDTIAWSYGLLSEPQRVLFRRLAVLSGGISFESAAALGGLPRGDTQSAVLDTLTALVDHNLLTAKVVPAAPEPRMNILQTIREYALEMLVEHGEYDEMRRLHAVYFVELGEAVDASFASEPTAVWLARLQSEHENFRAALIWAFEDGGDPHIGARLVTVLGRYWFERGLFREARRWLERAQALAAATNAATAARIALYAAFVANYEGDYVSGAIAAREALDAYTREGDVAGCTQARNALGIAALYTGDVDRAEEQFSETLHTQRARADRRGVAVALHNLGEVATECRFDLALGEERYEESLSLFREIGHTLNVATTLGSLGELHAYRGDVPRAIRFALQAIEAYTELDNRPLIAEGLTRLARYELSAGDAERARGLLSRAVEQLRMSFNPPHVASCFEAYASLANVSRAPELAALFLGYSQYVRDCYRIPLLPASQRRHSVVIDATRLQLAPAEFDDMWQQGHALRPDEAFEASLRV